MITNRKGVTLMELLAYLALVGIVVTLMTGTMSYAVRSYNNVNGQGAIYTEANFIMSTLITKANVFNPQYVRSCGTNCVELVIETEKVIDYDLGLIVEKPINKASQIKFVKKNDDPNNKVYNIYIGAMKLNSSDFGILYDESQLSNSGEIQYSCYDGNTEFGSICQRFVLTLKLAIVRINKNDEITSDTPYIFENRFSF